MTDQEHAEVIRAAAKSLDEAIKAAVGGGLNIHVITTEDTYLACGLTRHIGIPHIEVFRAL